MGSSDSCSFSLSSLLCQEDESSLSINEGHHQKYDLTNPNFTAEDDEGEEGYIQDLFKKETLLFGSTERRGLCLDDCSCNSRSWLRCARLDAVQWILNKRATFGFKLQTAYLSVSYFDRFLSRRSIDDGKLWAIRLLSIACLTLGAKMEESRVPSLSELSVEDFCFENKVIQRMELLVLSTLEWKMGLVTPFAYLNHFVRKISGKSRPEVILSKASEFVVSVAREIDLVNHPPSSIALAAVLATFDNQLTRKTMEPRLSEISSLSSLDIDHVFSLYNLMQEIERTKSTSPNSEVISSKLWSTNTSSIAAQQRSCVTSGGTKRRLEFDEDEQSCPVPNMHKT